MAIKLEGKREIVAEVNETADRAVSLVVADSRGCTVDEKIHTPCGASFGRRDFR